mmetsp:Transcript_50414/g.133975  ORF Transcript_50414/g.133975 Transcript_50414/m.133975 type:complete len:80 (+) Transcript_50414:948-1187(+)
MVNSWAHGGSVTGSDGKQSMGNAALGNAFTFGHKRGLSGAWLHRNWEVLRRSSPNESSHASTSTGMWLSGLHTAARSGA